MKSSKPQATRKRIQASQNNRYRHHLLVRRELKIYIYIYVRLMVALNSQEKLLASWVMVGHRERLSDATSIGKKVDSSGRQGGRGKNIRHEVLVPHEGKREIFHESTFVLSYLTHTPKILILTGRTTLTPPAFDYNRTHPHACINQYID